MNNPLSSERLTTMFRTSPKDEFRIINREGSTIEFKESYNHANMAEYFKTIAAFANNSGGYIIFGVGDKPRRLIGLQEKSLQQFETLRVEEFTQALNEYFSPEIRWDHCTFESHKLSFGVIYIYALVKKPCVCKKHYDANNTKYTLREGDIFYRYGGRSERIKYPELVSILEEQRKQEEQLWMNLFQNAAKIGIDNACLLDFESGKLSGKGGSIFIDSDSLKKIAFIREGEFVETKGAPTLRLIGDVETIGEAKVVVSERTKRVIAAIETADIISGFLQNTTVEEPLEFIKVVCSKQSANYPVYHYVRQSGLSISEVISVISKVPSRNKGKGALIERLQGKMVEQIAISTAGGIAAEKKRHYKAMWMNEQIPEAIEHHNYCLEALKALSEDEIRAHDGYIRTQLLRIFAEIYENASGNLASTLRKAICRVDEVLNS